MTFPRVGVNGTPQKKPFTFDEVSWTPIFATGLGFGSMGPSDESRQCVRPAPNGTLVPCNGPLASRLKEQLQHDYRRPTPQMPRESSLPIDALIPRVIDSLERSQFVVLEAAPGAGKTTRVPKAIYESRRRETRQVVVTEPRRLAARLAATYVAQEMGVRVGDVVGYSVRYDDTTSAATRIRFVTEGVLLQQLLSDPQLSFAHTIVLDEFHERHLATDGLLALLNRLCTQRTDLRVVIMSATLEGKRIAEFLGNCPHLESEGRVFPLEIRHQPGPDDRPLAKRVASGVRDALREQSSGHVLVFLPGSREIQRAKAALEKQSTRFALHVLHGEQNLQTQAAAVAPSSERKVILATNVAESSITIDGVTAVVDSGLARVAAFSSFSGRATLSVGPISKSSAIQRAGRAGRTAPGLVLRLYEAADFQRRPERDEPEIARLDLTDFMLQLRSLGVSPDDLRWLTPPKATAIDAATELLKRLGAVQECGTVTKVGHRMLSFGLPPRIARTLVSAEQRGIANDGCLAAALLSERDIRQFSTGDWDLPTAESDLQDRMDAFREAEALDFRVGALRSIGLDPSRVRAVERAYRALRRRTKNASGAVPAEQTEERLRRCLLEGFSDRVALHQPAQRRLILMNGTTARVSERSVVRTSPYVVALEEEERSDGKHTGAIVQWVAKVEPEWLFDLFSDEIEAQDELRFDPTKRRVESISRLAYGSVTLEESRLAAPPSPEATRLLLEAAKAQKAALLGKNPAAQAIGQRVALLQQIGLDDRLPRAEQFSDDALLELACEGLTAMSELESVDFEQVALGRLTHEQRRLLEQETPEHITLPGGRRLSVNYEAGKPPWIASRLQDFFGMSHGPRICRGRVALTLHLLAPNQRAVQVTSDLEGFWERHYAEVRKELRRRYAKHSWPEDGRTAEPPQPRQGPRTGPRRGPSTR